MPGLQEAAAERLDSLILLELAGAENVVKKVDSSVSRGGLKPPRLIKRLLVEKLAMAC